MTTRSYGESAIPNWLKRFGALWLLIILCAGIPFGPFAMFLGLAPATIVAAVLASLVTTWQPGAKLGGLLLIYLVLTVINIALFWVSV